MTTTDPKLIERIARALTDSPDTLYEHHEWEAWPVDKRNEYKDAFTGEDRVQLFHYAWRRKEKRATAILPIVAAAINEAVQALEGEISELERKHSVVEAELTANERMVDKLKLALRDAVSTATENARQRDAAINEAAHQWQDIATAPRDGSCIIAGRFGRSNELCWVKHSRWITAAEAAENEGQGFDAEDYEDGWTDGSDDWECCYPTHWMPLPPPPAIEAKESQP